MNAIYKPSQYKPAHVFSSSSRHHHHLWEQIGVVTSIKELTITYVYAYWYNQVLGILGTRMKLMRASAVGNKYAEYNYAAIKYHYDACGGNYVKN